MKGTIKFSLKLFVLMIAASVISIISMMLVLSASIQFVYKVIMGLLFIAFTEILVWNNASQRGEEDTKSGIFSPGKGFVSASIALLPAIILAVYYIILSYHGWEGNNQQLASSIYFILYLIFIGFSPLLTAFTPFNPALSINIPQPAISYIKNITTPNAVFAPMFFIPIVLITITAGIAYIYGNKSREKLKQLINKNKKQY